MFFVNNIVYTQFSADNKILASIFDSSFAYMYHTNCRHIFEYWHTMHTFLHYIYDVNNTMISVIMTVGIVECHLQIGFSNYMFNHV